MDQQETNYALAKQIPLGCEKITLDTDYGRLVLEGDTGRKAAKAIRRILMMHQAKESNND